MPRHIIITDSNIAALYKDLFPLGEAVLIVPAGEGSKTLLSAQMLLSEMSRRGCGRETTVVAVGGGMVMDLAGFVASTFCRGVPLVLVPTTVLAMVDAAIGGKTAVNLPEGKNLVGSFYFPKRVIWHLPFLETLPAGEWENGIVEVLKVGLVADEDLFCRFSNFPVATWIERAVEAKRRIIAQDPYEKGKRALLNLGHTIGHALESASEYQISHGRAVAAGTVLEARLSALMGFLSGSDLKMIEDSFPEVEIPFPPEQIRKWLKVDKKSREGTAHFVLLEGIGRPFVKEERFCHPVPEEFLMKVLNDACLCSC